MHHGIEKKQGWSGGLKPLLWMWALVACFGYAQAQAPKGVVLTDADLGKETVTAIRFNEASTSVNIALKHRFTTIGPVEVTSPKATQFDGPFTVSQTFPFVLNPSESKDLNFKVNYGKGIKESTDVILLVGAPGEKDPKKLVALKFSLSAEGRLMFWDEKNKTYLSGISNMVFDGPGEKIIEVTWNGAGAGGPCNVGIEGDTRGAFKLVPNASGAQPLSNGASVTIGKNGVSYFVKYSGPGSKGSAVDIGRLVFKDDKGHTLSADMMGTRKGGAAAIAAKATTDPNAQGPGKVGTLNMDLGRNNQVGAPAPGKDIIKHSTGIPGLEPSIAATKVTPTDASAKPLATTDPSAKAKPVAVTLPPAFSGSITDPVVAQAHLERYYALRKGENIISVGEVTFKEVEDIFEARFKIILDSLDKDKALTIKPMWVSALTGDDSLPVPMTNVEYDQDSMLLRVKLPSETVDAVTEQDSFLLKVGFMPEYLAGNTPVYLVDQKSMFTGTTIGRVYTESYFWLWIWLAIVLTIGLFFFLGFLWVRRPISTFRYLRESRYQRDRYAGRDEDVHIEIETIHLDLSRHESDLIQLAYNLHGHGSVTGAADGTGKVRALDATVAAPVRRGLKRFYVWFYGLFGMSKEPRFRSVYYSLRIEPIQGGIPQNLRLKDESGVLLLGTSLTGNVLSTDHQDFRFTTRPFQYRIYLDPSEILDYSGTMRTVSIPFRVIEEPFEGYVMTRDFRLNLDMKPKA